MNWFWDILTVLVLLAAAGYGREKGFVRSLAGIIILIASVFCASLIAEKLAAPITNWIQPMVQDALMEKLRGNALVRLDNLPESIQILTGKAVAAGESMAAAVARGIVYNVVRTVLYVVGFFVARFFLGVFIRPLTKLFNKIPLVGGINKLLGTVLGVLGGVVAVYAAIWVLQNFHILKAETLAQTHVLRFFAQYSLVELFSKMLSVKDQVTAFLGSLKK